MLTFAAFGEGEGDVPNLTGSFVAKAPDKFVALQMVEPSRRPNLTGAFDAKSPVKFD